MKTETESKIHELKGKFVNALQKIQNKQTTEIAKKICDIIKENSHFKSTIFNSKYDSHTCTFAYDNNKCYCIDISPFKIKNSIITNDMIHIVEVPYCEFIKNNEFIY